MKTKQITFGFLTGIFLMTCAKKDDMKLIFEKIQMDDTIITFNQTYSVSKDLKNFTLTVCVQGEKLNKGYIDIHSIDGPGHNHGTTEEHEHDDDKLSSRRIINFTEGNCISEKYAELNLAEAEEKYHVLIGVSNKMGKSSNFYFELEVKQILEPLEKLLFLKY